MKSKWLRGYVVEWLSVLCGWVATWLSGLVTADHIAARTGSRYHGKAYQGSRDRGIKWRDQVSKGSQDRGKKLKLSFCHFSRGCPAHFYCNPSLCFAEATRKRAGFSCKDAQPCVSTKLLN